MRSLHDRLANPTVLDIVEFTANAPEGCRAMVRGYGVVFFGRCALRVVQELATAERMNAERQHKFAGCLMYCTPLEAHWLCGLCKASAAEHN